MSNLKVYHCNEWHNEYTEFHMKCDVDALLSEKDKEIEELKAQLESEKAARHRYKRCLDNAWWCRKLSNAYTWDACTHRGWTIAGYYDKKAEFYRKWRGRWIKIAERFKEADK